MPDLPKLNHPWLIAVWPGMGHVALNAGVYLLAKLEMTAVAEELSGHAEIVFTAATSGKSNLVAIAVCRDFDAFYDYLSERIGALHTVSHVETAPVLLAVKRAGRVLPLGGSLFPSR